MSVESIKAENNIQDLEIPKEPFMDKVSEMVDGSDNSGIASLELEPGGNVPVCFALH